MSSIEWREREGGGGKWSRRGESQLTSKIMMRRRRISKWLPRSLPPLPPPGNDKQVLIPNDHLTNIDTAV